MVVGHERLHTGDWNPLEVEAVVWTSPDQTTWTRSAVGEFGAGSFMRSMVTIGSKTVVVGGVSENTTYWDGGYATVWIRE